MRSRNSHAPAGGRRRDSSSPRPRRAREQGQALVAAMCHEFRTPLNAILGLSQLLSSDNTLSADARRRVQGIERAGAHLLRLIEEALEVSLIESGKAQVHSTAFELQSMLEEVRDLFEAEADRKHLALEFRVAVDTPTWIISDPLKLRQILINLVGNAVKFTRQGSVLVLIGADDPVGDRCHLEVQVIDTGPGIDASEQERVFEKFIRGSGHAHHGGTGLGLSISQQYARLMGGEITLESALGRGSVFKLHVPVTWLRYPADELEGGAPSSPIPSSRQRRSERVAESRESGTFAASEPEELETLAMSETQARALLTAAAAGDRDEIFKLLEQGARSPLTAELGDLARAYEYRKIIELLETLFPI
jgi:hypothetical protein